MLKLISIWILSISFATAGEIKIGMSTALSGPLRDVGQNMRLGVQTYFDKVNQTGGVNGHTLKLISKDDGYEPKRAAVNMRNLIEKQHVLAIIGNVGTPTSVVSVPIAIESNTLFFGALSGAGLLRKPEYFDHVVNFRASYAEETAAMVNGLLSMGIEPEEIAFFTQRDSYGQSGFQGAVDALGAHGFNAVSLLAHGRYTRNTLNVEEAVATLLDVKTTPKAVIMVGGYAPSAKFIKLAKREIPDLLFLNVSFVGSIALVNALEGETDNVIITQVVPDFRSTLSAAQDYRQELKKFAPDSTPGFVSFEGYLTAKVFVEALKKQPDHMSKESIVNSLYTLDDIDIGIDVKVGYSEQSNQAVHKVWTTIYKNDQFQPFEWVPEAVDSGAKKRLVLTEKAQ